MSVDELLFDTPLAIGLRLSERVTSMLEARRIASCRAYNHALFPGTTLLRHTQHFLKAEFFEFGAFSYAEARHYLVASM